MKKYLINIYEAVRRQYLFLKRRLVAPRIPVNPDGKVYLNLGGGPTSGQEFINVDVLPYPIIHHLQDITDLANFPDGSADMIYASHVVEHIPRQKLMSTLREWQRVLKSGGTFRFAVPNFDALVEIYQGSERNVERVRDQVLGQEPPYHNHYTLWNFEYAQKILSELGYRDIRIWSADQVEHHDFEDRATRSMRVGDRDVLFSLNIEAVKP